MHQRLLTRRRVFGAVFALGALTACASGAQSAPPQAQAPNTGFELHLLNGTFASLQLGYEPEPAIAKLTASKADAAYVVREDEIDFYDWSSQRLRLAQQATVRLLKAMRSQRSGTPESILSKRGFVVTVDGVPQFAGIALERISAMAIRYPVMYVDVTNAAKLELSFRPRHAPDNAFDPRDPAWTAVKHQPVKQRFDALGKLAGDTE